MNCEAVITERAARDLYDRLLAIQGADGCTLDEVETDKTWMTVIWKAGGSALPAAEVVRQECASSDALAGPTLAIRVPQPLRSACPSTVTAAVAIVRKETFEAPPVAPLRSSRSPRVAVEVVGVVALAVVAFNVAMVLRHRNRPAPK
jgi:hypothetical protein